MASPSPTSQKLKVLCFHGFRTSASIFHKQIARWDPRIRDLLDLTFLDGPYPAAGKSDVEGIFPPPYFEWYQFNKDFSAYTNLEECKEFVSNYMVEHGPFDGLMGFSQGGVLAAALAALQLKGLALQRHPPLRFVILISGAGFNNRQMMDEHYADPVRCPSVHIIASQDYLKKVNEELATKFEDPVVIRHDGKHTVPRLGEEATITLRDFLLRVQSIGPEHKDEVQNGSCDGDKLNPEERLQNGFEKQCV